MSKPILIIRFPKSNSSQQTSEMLYAVKNISEHLTDYHVLSLMDNRRNEIEFECLNSPHEEKEFEKLKKELLNTFLLNSTKK